MLFHIEVECRGAAMADDLTGELARMLRTTADKVGRGEKFAHLLDANGNSVGTFWFEDED